MSARNAKLQARRQQQRQVQQYKLAATEWLAGAEGEARTVLQPARIYSVQYQYTPRGTKVGG